MTDNFAERDALLRGEGPGRGTAPPSTTQPRPTVAAALREIAWACEAAAVMLRMADQFDPNLKRGRTTRRAMNAQAENMVRARMRAMNLADQFEGVST